MEFQSLFWWKGAGHQRTELSISRQVRLNPYFGGRVLDLSIPQVKDFVVGVSILVFVEGCWTKTPIEKSALALLSQSLFSWKGAGQYSSSSIES